MKKEIGNELRNIKRVFVYNKALDIMQKKKPWTQMYHPKTLFLVYAVYCINKRFGFAKQRQITDFMKSFARSIGPNDLQVAFNTGLLDRDKSLGVYSYRCTPKGLEYLRTMELYIKITRIDKKM